MTELIKQHTTKWAGFWVVFLSYALVQAGTDTAAWLSAIGKEGWNNIGGYDWASLGTKVAIGVGLTLRMLQNGTFQETKQNGKDAAGVAAAAP